MSRRIQVANARFTARNAIIYTSLSAGARLLYIALDDMARDRGNWFIKQHELAVKLGYSGRQLRRFIAELEPAWLIATTTGTSTLFQLSWAGRTPASYLGEERSDARVLPEWPPVSDRTDGHANGLAVVSTSTEAKNGRSTVQCACGAYHEETGQRCYFCNHVHYEGCQECKPVDAIAEAKRMLHGYVDQCRLGWPAPGDDICTMALDAVDGSLIGLQQRLRWLFLEKRAAPSRSYMWFVTVLNAYRRTA